MISRRQPVETGGKGTSPEGDLEAPKDKGSSTEATALGAAPAPNDLGRKFSLHKVVFCEHVRITTLLNDFVGGTILGLMIIFITIVLDYRDIIHFQSAHNVRHAAFQLLNNTETIANIEESEVFKFMKWDEYESILKEINSAPEKIALRKKHLEERTAEAEEKHKEVESIAPEHESLMLRKEEFQLDKFCGGCMWVGKTTCNERVDFMKRTYHVGTVAAMVNALQFPSCRQK